jgi:RimJ/RimL family protein N-acetyltransferase
MHIRIRPWQPEDLETLVQLANNPRIAANVRDSFPQPYTNEAGTAWIESQRHKQPYTSFAIEVDGQFAGGIGVEPKADIYRCSMELGYWLGEPYWGKGIATAAIGQLCNYVWNTYPDIVRLYAEVFAHNTSSMRALEKNGFQLEGIRKKAAVKNGVILDDYVWVLLRS